MSKTNVVSRVMENVRKKLTKRRHSQLSLERENMIALGNVDPADELAVCLHNTAMTGTKPKLKRLLTKGISIDYPNSYGQTPLFCATLYSNENTATLLLHYGADPNRKDHKGMTPVHVACYIGSVGLLCKAIEEGGDVCIVDSQDQGIMEWAAKNHDFEARNTMIAFLQQARVYGIMSGAQENGYRIDSKIPNFGARPLQKTSVMEMVHKATGSDISLASAASDGFGAVYPCAKDSSAIVSVVPLISECILDGVAKSDSFKCSLDFNMKPMMWKTSEVNVKSLCPEHKISGKMNVILAEASFLSKLRHPNIILLMAVCQPNTMDNMTLVFERVHNRNVYQCLHIDKLDLPQDLCVLLSIQLSSAMGYIHDQGYIHCGLTSHAVYLSHNLIVKLGNFEFMVESSLADNGILSRVNDHENMEDVYNWMSPQMIRGGGASKNCDVFSFCCVLWEIFAYRIPWDWLSPKDLFEIAFASEHPQLPMKYVPEEIEHLIERGIRRKDDHAINFNSIYNFLKDMKEKLNKSHNSLRNEGVNHKGQMSSEAKTNQTSVQDQLVFSDRDLQSQGKSFRSTSAITTTVGNQDNTGCNKNSSEGDLQSLQQASASSHPPMKPVHSQPSIKPASHHHQPASFIAKPSTCITRPPNNTGLVETKQESNQSKEEEAVVKPKIGSVRELAEDYQQIVSQHKLRQAILKGSKAPQGGCSSNDQTPQNTSRWHSLPSTIRELSKSWSADEESPKTGLSDLVGNVSFCTNHPHPHHNKHTSTPLRRGGEGKGGGANTIGGLVDYFKRQKSLWGDDVPPSRKVDGGVVEEELDQDVEEVDTSTKERTDVMVNEMKLVVSQRKSLLVEEEHQHSLLGVSYQSPIIEVHERKSSLMDNFNHTFLQTADDERNESSLSESYKTLEQDQLCGNGKEERDEVNAQEQQYSDDSLEMYHSKLEAEDKGPSKTDSLENYHYSLEAAENSPSKTAAVFENCHRKFEEKTPSDSVENFHCKLEAKGVSSKPEISNEFRADAGNFNETRDVECIDRKVSSIYNREAVECVHGLTKDSFWDLTGNPLTHWPEMDSNQDSVDAASGGKHMEEEEVCPETNEQRVTSGEAVEPDLSKDDDVVEYQMVTGDVEEGLLVVEDKKQIVQNRAVVDNDDDVECEKDTTFCIVSSAGDGKNEMDLNTTFTLDANADATEPDSWFPDTALSDGDSHLISAADDSDRSGMSDKCLLPLLDVNTQGTAQCISINSSHDNPQARNVLYCDGVHEVKRSVEFEYQEFYIDDDLDTSEHLQDVPSSNESNHIIMESHQFSSSEGGSPIPPPSPLPTPTSNTHTDDVGMHDNAGTSMDDSNPLKLKPKTQTIITCEDENKEEISECKKRRISDVKVKDKIAQFDGMMIIKENENSVISTRSEQIYSCRRSSDSFCINNQRQSCVSECDLADGCMMPVDACGSMDHIEDGRERKAGGKDVGKARLIPKVRGGKGVDEEVPNRNQDHDDKLGKVNQTTDRLETVNIKTDEWEKVNQREVNQKRGKSERVNKGTEKLKKGNQRVEKLGKEKVLKTNQATADKLEKVNQGTEQLDRIDKNKLKLSKKKTDDNEMLYCSKIPVKHEEIFFQKYSNQQIDAQPIGRCNWSKDHDGQIKDFSEDDDDDDVDGGGCDHDVNDDTIADYDNRHNDKDTKEEYEEEEEQQLDLEEEMVSVYRPTTTLNYAKESCRDGDCWDDSDNWINKKLHSIQEKIRRRRQRAVYTVSSEEDEERGEREIRLRPQTDDSDTLPLSHQDEEGCGGREWRWVDEGGKLGAWDCTDDDIMVDSRSKDCKHNTISHSDEILDTTLSNWDDFKSYASPVSSSERCSLPNQIARTRLPYINSLYKNKTDVFRTDDCDIPGTSKDFDQLNPPENTNKDQGNNDLFQSEYSPQSSRNSTVHSRMSRALSAGHFPNSEKKTNAKKRLNSQKAHCRSMENVKAFLRGTDTAHQNLLPQKKTCSDTTKPCTGKLFSDRTRVPVPRPRSHGNLRSNESKSSVRTVMFEDETDGLMQFSPRISRDSVDASSMHREWRGSGSGSEMERDEQSADYFNDHEERRSVSWIPRWNTSVEREYQDWYVNDDGEERRSIITTVGGYRRGEREEQSDYYDHDERKSVGSTNRRNTKGEREDQVAFCGNNDHDERRSVTSLTRRNISDAVDERSSNSGVCDKTFDIMREDESDIDRRHLHQHQQGGEDSMDASMWVGDDHGAGGTDGEDDHDPRGQGCVTLGLDHDDKRDSGPCSQDKLCTIGENVYTEVHRFYIPKSKWPDGYKTRFHLDVCPANPRRHRLSTSAIDPVTGRREVLIERTVDTDRLKSHLTVD